MYTIYVYDGEHWQHVLSNDDRYTVESATLSESVNAAPVLTFKVYEGHPSLSYLLAAIESSLPATAQPTIMARRDGSTCFEGRIYQHVLDDLTGAHEFACEGMLARLNDYTVSPYSYSGTVSGYLDMLLTECEGALSVGNVTVTDPNDYIVRSSEQPVMLWDEIADKCIGSTLGGFLEMRSGYIVDWLTQPSASTATQDMEAGINLTGLNITVQPREMYSGVLAYGAEVGVTNSKGVPLYYNLSFLSASDVPTGYTLTGMTLFKDSLVDQIGHRVCIMHYESITQVSNLMDRAVAFLNAQSTTPVIQVGAVDLADAGYNADAIECGSTVQITGATFDASMMCTAISRDLLDPSNTTFEFGSSESISGSSGSGGSGGGGSVTSPHFWHTALEDSETETGRSITGFSTEPLEDVITDVANRRSTVSGGAVWLNSATLSQWSMYYGNLEARLNQASIRVSEALRPTTVTPTTSNLLMMGGSASLGAAGDSANASINANGISGSINLTATNAVNVSADTNITGNESVTGHVTSNELTYTSGGGESQLSNPNHNCRVCVTSAGNLRRDLSADGGESWTASGYYANSGIAANVNSTISEIVTQTTAQAGNYTITAASYAQWGRMVQVVITIQPTAAVSAGASMSIGTIVAGKRPTLLAVAGSTYMHGGITTAGAISMRCRTAMTAGTSYNIAATYILA